MNTTLMNKNEQTAHRNIKAAFNHKINELYNSLMDGYDIPSKAEAELQVYNNAMNHLYRKSTVVYDRAPKEMRFAGEDFCKEIVEELFLNDPTVEEIWSEECEEHEEESTMSKDYSNMTVAQLREEAKAKGIKNAKQYKKQELVSKLQAASAEQEYAEVTVRMFAFTGMYIGEFEAEVQDGTILVYTEHSGELLFNADTGVQICPEEKARYANRVEMV